MSSVPEEGKGGEALLNGCSDLCGFMGGYGGFLLPRSRVEKPPDASIPAYSFLTDEIQLQVRHPQEVNSPTHTLVVGPEFISVGAADFGKIGGWRWRRVGWV